MKPRIRLIGFALAVFALALIYFFVWSPLVQAQSGTHGTLRLSTKLIVISPGFLLVGLWLLVFAPLYVLENNPADKRGNLLMAGLFVAGCVAGCFVDQWLHAQLVGLGFLHGG